jgi:hypothetical protein
MKNTALNIEIPEELLTDADIAGRAIRIARTNWLPLLRFFLPQAIAYSIATTCLVEDFSDSGMNIPDSVRYWAIIAGFTLMLFSLWEWGIRSYALIHALTKGDGNLDKSLEVARTNMWRCLVIMVPVFLSETLIYGMLAAGIFFSKLAGAVESSELDPSGIIAGILVISPLLLTVPLSAVINANVFYLAIVAIEESSLLRACGRFFQLAFHHFKYFCVFTCLLASISLLSQTAVGALASLTALIPKSPLRLIADIVIAVTLFPPTDAFISAATAIGVVCLYKQLCNRREGRDILDKLEKLQQSSAAS